MNRKLIISLMVIPLLFGGFAYAETKTLLGDLRIYNPDPTIFLSPPTTGETKAWIGIREDAGGDNNDSIMFGIGNDKASGEIVEIDKDGTPVRVPMKSMLWTRTWRRLIHRSLLG